jgi:hypothetical protein
MLFFTGAGAISSKVGRRSSSSSSAIGIGFGLMAGCVVMIRGVAAATRMIVGFVFATVRVWIVRGGVAERTAAVFRRGSVVVSETGFDFIDRAMRRHVSDHAEDASQMKRATVVRDRVRAVRFARARLPAVVPEKSGGCAVCTRPSMQTSISAFER